MKDSFTRLNFSDYFTCCSITFGHIIQLQRRSIPSPFYVNTVPCHISNARPGEGDGLHFIDEPERVVKHFVLYLKFDKNIFHWTSVIFSQSTEKRLKGNCLEQLTWKRQRELFKFDSRAASMQGKTARIWRAFGDERDHSGQKSRFRERKVARKPGMLPQTNLLKCMRSSWQFPFNVRWRINWVKLWGFFYFIKQVEHGFCVSVLW